MNGHSKNGHSKTTCLENGIMAHEAARMLLEVGAAHFRPHDPYILTSGMASPVYLDCRKLISYPRIRTMLMDFAVTRIQRDVGYEAFDAVAGGETAGIPFAAWIADRLSLPMLYVRKKPKGFGRNAQIEGDLKEGARVLLVEDMSTDGGSKFVFAEALRHAGAVVAHSQVIFYYNIFAHAADNLAKAGLSLHYLTTWRDVLEVCRTENRFDEQTLSEIEGFIADPIGWSERARF